MFNGGIMRFDSSTENMMVRRTNFKTGEKGCWRLPHPDVEVQYHQPLIGNAQVQVTLRQVDQHSEREHVSFNLSIEDARKLGAILTAFAVADEVEPIPPYDTLDSVSFDL
jgi:hypothetical protein